jgi:hypothetical protein
MKATTLIIMNAMPSMATKMPTRNSRGMPPQLNRTSLASNNIVINPAIRKTIPKNTENFPKVLVL